MQFSLIDALSLALLVFSTLPIAQALGVNCRGSIDCKGNHDVMRLLTRYVAAIPDNAVYPPETDIACVNYLEFPGFCIFYRGNQNMVQISPNNKVVGITGAMLKDLLNRVQQHGCQGCGSIPVDFASNNPDRLGYVTVNSRDTKDCSGLCTTVSPLYVENPTISQSMAPMSTEQFASSIAPTSTTALIAPMVIEQPIAPVVTEQSMESVNTTMLMRRAGTSRL